MGKATLTYLSHMAWISGVLLVFGNQRFPWCCFEAAVVLIGFRTVEIVRYEMRLHSRRTRGLHARRTP